jgi:RHS repeat-associated protein
MARLFPEPLVFAGHQPSIAENRQLAAALREYERRAAADDFSALEQFLRANPNSAWTPAVWFNLATEYYNTGWYSKSLDAWRKTWPLLKNENEPAAKALADRAAGELAYMLARLGRMSELAELLDEVKDRVFVGSATEKIAGAQEGLWTMRNRPQGAFKCGPFALGRILSVSNPGKANDPLIRNTASTTNGCSLAQVADLSRQLGMNYQMAYRSNGAPILLPAVVNWKVGHYAALVRNENGLYLLQDPTFGNDTWVSARMLEEEASGYFLIPAGNLPRGWRSVSADEGAAVFGKGQTSAKDTTATTPADQSNCSAGSNSYWSLRGLFQWASSLIGHDPADHSQDPQSYPYIGIRGMAASSVQLALVNLNLRDNPVGYVPPVGPAIELVATYNQRDAGQPANFSYSNLGPKWTFNWLAYISDNPSSQSADVSFYTDGGGTLPFTGFNSGSQTFAPQMKTQAQLRRTSTNSYELLLPDGAKTIFSQPDHVGGTSRRVFMTQLIDPAGNSVQISYDGSFRVTAVTDSIGQVTTFSYTNLSNPLKITKVTDPFGRFASFTYDSSNRLASITDTLGLTSQFTYDSGDFIQALTTPYGTTSFQKGGSEPQRWLVTTYPDGEKDRVEFLESSVIGVPDSDPASTVPAGMATGNIYHVYRNSFYWDRNAYAQAPNDYTKARLYHWLHFTGGVCSSILESEKAPLENRIWFTYDGQGSPIFLGTSAQPNAVGRVLDDGTTQLQTFGYNSLGVVTNSVDPLGRSVTRIYSTNRVDLLEVRQTTGTNNELVARFLYNTQHLAVAMWDAAGQMTTNSYNSRGQLLATSNPKGETTSFVYDTNGYLVAVDGPLPGTADTVTFMYDSMGRVRAFSSTDGYSITNSYDNFDRLTNTVYPDGTSMILTYDKLDRVKVQDRQGRIAQFTYDALRRLVSVQDPLGRTVGFEHCNCGALSAFIDPMGRPTRWTYDIEGRVASKQNADGTRVLYGYENTTSRLKSVQDEKGQVKSYTYGPDDTLNGISYPIANVPTPSVTFAYDPNYRRIVSMQDGIGTTTYTYYPAGVSGALQMASASGPWSNDTVTYQYDQLGRATNRAINGVAEGCVYDALGRTTSIANPLGNFGYNFDGATGRLLDAYDPNGQSAHYDYFDNSGDRRLKRISHLKPDTSVISRFTYAYNSVGQITNWLQELNGLTNQWAFGYDGADQLLNGQLNQGGTNTSYLYGYDPAGNRLAETVGATNRTFQYSLVNELISSLDTSPTNTTYEWDAEQRLVAINQGLNRSEFYYDGDGRRRRVVEKTNGVVQSDKRYVWSGMELSEERDVSGNVLRRFFGQGFTDNGSAFFYTRDHLGSVREILDAAAQVQARYSYDPYGRATQLAGTMESPFGFAGYPFHSPSGLSLTLHRAYDSRTGRWLSRDPLGTMGGMNLYAYANNNPLNTVDPLGLCGVSMTQFMGGVGLVMIGTAAVLAAPEVLAALAAREVLVGGAEALAERAAVGEIAAEEETVSVFHGSIDNAQGIVEDGLSPGRVTNASRDFAAAQDAVSANRVDFVDPNRWGIVESRIPLSDFNRVFAPLERQYQGFYPSTLDSSEILMNDEAISIFNQNIVK